MSIEIDVPLGTVADRQRVVHRPFGFNREIPFYFAEAIYVNSNATDAHLKQAVLLLRRASVPPPHHSLPVLHTTRKLSVRHNIATWLVKD